MNPLRFPTIEALESRIAPAGIVTVNYSALTGILDLAGDLDANDVAVSRTGASTYRIEGLSNTALAGIPNVLPGIADIGKVTSLTFSGGLEADTLSLFGLNALNTLTVSGDAGADTLNARDLIVKGATVLSLGANGGQFNFAGDNTFGGDFTANYGADGGAVVAQSLSTFVVKGGIILNGGVGADQFSLLGTVATIGKGIKFMAGEGANALTIASTISTVGKSATGKSVQFDGGAQADSVTISGARATFLGSIEFSAGLGQNVFDATPASARVDGELKMTAGVNDDTFSWISASVNLKGPVNLDLGTAGAGDNTATFAGASVLLGSSLTVKGGSGTDTLNLGTGGSTDSITVKGAVTVALGDGSNKVAADGSLLSLGAALKVTGGADSDDVDFQSTFIGVMGKTELLLGEGVDSLTVGGNQAIFGGDVVVTSGDGGLSAHVTPAKLKIAGAVSVTTAAGDDTVEFRSAVLDLKKTLNITTGDGGDVVTVIGDGAVKGDVTIDLGALGAGTQFLDLTGTTAVAGNLKLGGKLTVSAATSAGVGNGDFITVTNVAVAKAIQITLSAADSVLKINNLFAADLLTIDTGAGADTVEIERDAFFGASSFAKKVTINLGADDDQILIGLSSAATSSSFGKFLGGLSIAGGGGVNTSNDLLNLATNFFKVGTVNTSDPTVV